MSNRFIQEIGSKKVGVYRDKEIYLYKLTNKNGVSIEITNYGATLVSFYVPDINGSLRNIVLGYKNIEDYFSDVIYLGATIGRYANRISGASFNMDGSTYILDKNDGENCNHGGFSGFNKKIFKSEILDNNVVMVAESHDGEGGFPGNIQLTVSYHLSDEDELHIDYKVTTDSKTPINITNHAYFNLSGEESILNHQLKIESETYLETDNDFLTTGVIKVVSQNTGFDFREFTKIQSNMQLKNEMIKGYNTYYISDEKNNNLKKLATLKSDVTEISLEVYSTMPGVMLYTGDYLSGVHQPFSGVSLEAHYFPDSPNKASFPESVASREKEWQEKVIYRFLLG